MATVREDSSRLPGMTPILDEFPRRTDAAAPGDTGIPARRRRAPLVNAGLAAALLLPLALVGCWLFLQWRALRLLETAKVTVVQADGRPAAGVFVSARWQVFGREHLRYVGRSDADGRVSLARIHGEWSTFGGFRVSASVPGMAEQEVELAADTRLVVPPLGRLLVQLVDAEGEAWRDPSLPLMLATLRSPGEVDQATQRFDAHGCCDFGDVVCGSELQVDARLQLLLLSQRLRGPERSGEERRVVLQVPADASCIVGRLVDARAQAVAGRIGVSAHSRRGCIAWSLQTAADGSFRFLTGGPGQRGGVLGGDFTVQFTCAGLAGEARGDGRATVCDLGTVVLAPPVQR